MTTWHYSEDGQAVGPFTLDALGKMQRAGLINGETPVHPSDDAPWIPYGEIQASEPTKPAAATTESFHYADASGKTLGPFSKEELLAFHAAGRISSTTLIARRGDAAWIGLEELVGSQGHSTGSAPTVSPGSGIQPVRRSMGDFMVLMAATLTLYTFYVVPSYTRDIRIITGKQRIEFKPLLILGIVTLSFALVVMSVAWAFDLEQYGKVNRTPGRQEALGGCVLALNATALLTLFWSGPIALIIGIVTGVWAVWMVQKEINLYAAPAA